MAPRRKPDGGGRAPAGPPPLLARLYGDGNVLCLRELLLRLGGASREAAALPAALVQPHDHADYSQPLLERTWCVLRPGAPALKDGFSLSQAASQQQLVGRAVEALLKSDQQRKAAGGGSGWGGVNVLCYGFRNRRPAAGGRSVPAMGLTTSEAFQHNSTTASLCSPAWQLLLSRIGDTLMLYLLTHASMFAELPNACCLQLSGPPIGQVARAWRKDAPAAVAAAATRLLAGAAAAPPAANGGGEGHVQGTGVAAQQQRQQPQTQAASGSSFRMQEPASLPSTAMEQDSGAAVEGAVAAGARAAVAAPAAAAATGQEVQQDAQQASSAAQSGKNLKPARPSSWQRRRAAKQRAQQEAQQAAGQRAQQAAQQAAGQHAQQDAQREAQRGVGEEGEGEADAMQVDGDGSEWALPATQDFAMLDPLASQPAQALAAAAAAWPEAAAAGAAAAAATAAAGAAAQPVTGAAPAAAGAAGAAHGTSSNGPSSSQRSSWPQRMPRPTDMLLQRSSIFYCASFPRKPGLTTQHMLHKLRDAKQAERALYAAIFDPKHNPVGRAGASMGAAHSLVPPPAHRVPAKHRHLLPLLKQLIVRAGKCPFGLLLQHHCPLPPQLRQQQQRQQQRQALAAAAPAAAAAAPGITSVTNEGAAAGGQAAGAGLGPVGRQAPVPLPSQGTLLQQVRQQQRQVGQEPHVAVAPSAEQLMDELFALEQGKPAGQANQLDPQEQQQQQQHQGQRQGQQQREAAAVPAATPPAGQAATIAPVQQAGREAPTADELMDELLLLEQHQQQQRQKPRAKRQKQDAPAPAAVAEAAQPAATAAEAAAPRQQPAAARASLGSLLPTQPAGTGDAAAEAAAAAAAAAALGAGQPAAAATIPLASCFVPHKRVAAFVWAVVRSVVPPALLGDAHNRRTLHNAISRFVRLRRYEQLSLHQVLQGMRLSGLAWLQPRHAQQQQQQQQRRQEGQGQFAGSGSTGAQQRQAGANEAAGQPGRGGAAVQQSGQLRRRQQQQQQRHQTCPTQHAAQQRMLALWMGWLFTVLVAPLLRAHFYCTESEAYRQQVFYYRKPVWAALARAATEELRDRQFAALSDRQAQAILQSRKLGVARLRLLPKRTGMRFIVNLGRSSTVRFPGAKQRTVPGVKRRQRAPAVKLTFRPVNNLLQGVYQVLRFEASCQPHLLGASVFGHNDAFCRLQPFLRKWRAAAEAAAAAGAALQPYIVSVDVTRAFDNVDIPLLLSIVEPLLRNESYIVLKYQEVVPSLGQVKVLHRRLAAAAPQGGQGPAPFPQLATRWAAMHKGKVFTDQVVYERISRQQALDLLRQHLTANLVRLRRRWCAQACGIAQGSTLSTLLCSLYLAHLERTQLAPLLELHSPADPGAAAAAAGQGALAPQQQQQQHGPVAGGASVSAAVGPGVAADDTSTPADRLIRGVSTVVCLSEGQGAALCPATVLAATPSGAGTSGGSKGLLTELAKAAESLATAPSATQATLQTAEQPPAPNRRRPASASGSGRRSQSGLISSFGAARADLTGDLLLLPAGAQPAGPAAAAAAADTSVRGGIASPVTVGTTLRRPQQAASHGQVGAAGTAGALPSPRSTPSQPQVLAQLGCSRLALHAGSVLLRLVDDFMLVTAIPSVARSFALAMLDGFESHNVAVNSDKTKLSFALQLAAASAGDSGERSSAARGAASTAGGGQGGVMPATVWRSGCGATFVKWCGLLLNTETLELQGDYTRYCGEHIATSLTLPLRKRPGAQLAARLCHYLRPKIHPLLLDASINSPQTVRLNLYQAFLLAAMKFHCYVRALPAAPAPGAALLLDAILSGIAFMNTLTRRRRVAAAHQQGLEVDCCTRVPQGHIRWLGLTAFIRVLRRKQTAYTALLAQLQELADAPALRGAARQLAAVVEPARSSVFDSILY